MTKRYATTYSTGLVVETNSAHEANNFAYDPDQTFALSGKPVSSQQFIEAVEEGMLAWLEKKSRTHKRVSVQHGATSLGRVTKWVRR